MSSGFDYWWGFGFFAALRRTGGALGMTSEAALWAVLDSRCRGNVGLVRVQSSTGSG